MTTTDVQRLGITIRACMHKKIKFERPDVVQLPELNCFFTSLTVGHFTLPFAASRLRRRLPNVPQHR